MFSAKAISGCYLFTRNMTFLCTRFWRSQSDPKDPTNIQRFFSVVVDVVFDGEDIGRGAAGKHSDLEAEAGEEGAGC